MPDYGNIDSQQVTVSGTVGKQVFAAGSAPKAVKLAGFILSPGAVSAASVVIRSGNASGDVKYDINTALKDPKQILTMSQRFDNGMHVKVIGTGASVFLQIC